MHLIYENISICNWHIFSKKIYVRPSIVRRPLSSSTCESKAVCKRWEKTKQIQTRLLLAWAAARTMYLEVCGTNSSLTSPGAPRNDCLCSIYDLLWHYNVGLNVVFQTLESYTYIYFYWAQAGAHGGVQGGAQGAGSKGGLKGRAKRRAQGVGGLKGQARGARLQ